MVVLKWYKFYDGKVAESIIFFQLLTNSGILSED